ncbi:MAG TPA: beta-N-acetylhexosaminidase [Bacteroidales bacterium]|nr:beta-N-acetylhexosaminidase [Bacteroidales bacterium]
MAVIPQPSQVEQKSGFFIINDSTRMVLETPDQRVRKAAIIFIDDLRKKQSLNLTLDEGGKSSGINTIHLKLVSPEETGKEGYVLESGRKGINISSGTPAGLFYGLMTIEQIALTANQDGGSVTVPAMKVEDSPRFDWRGMHLDVCRHFMPVEAVKKYIDYLALYKFNHFHWHLTEDQGWRIEIKKYPKLTSVGAWRDSTMVGNFSSTPLKYDGKRYGGFYTQEEARDIVRYAADRFITVIPEIEMPGHAQAAIAAYPELGVTGEKVGVKCEWGISPYIYMPSEKTFSFLEDVLTEVMAVFPSEYIHIGGDEAIKDQWKESPGVQALIKELNLKDEEELQSYFIHRMEKFLNAKGRSIIGWDEILQGGLAPNATVMSWRGEKGGIAAAKMDHNVVMSPGNYCYFDHYQAKPVDDEPLAIGGYLPLDTVYAYNPVPKELTAAEAEHILGVQANVWTEYIPDFRQVEYMIFPRLLAMSEVAWTQPGDKNQDLFHAKVLRQVNLFNKLGVNYSETGMPPRPE